MSKHQDVNRLEQFYVLDNEDQSLRDDVRLLGALLGDTIRHQHGNKIYELVEEIRQLAKDARQTETSDTSDLIARLGRLDTDEMVILARAFALFLNLANIAEQHHQVRQRRLLAASPVDSDAGAQSRSFLEAEFDKFRNCTSQRFFEVFANQQIVVPA